MRIAIVTAFHEREETARIVCESLAQLRLDAGGHDIALEICAVYDGETQPKGPTHIVRFPNNPISDRMNRACLIAKPGGPDAVIFIGGDNIINLPYLLWVRDQIADGADVCGPIDCYFYRRLTGEQAYWAGYEGRRAGEPIGAGRAISRRVLEKVDWQPWPMGLNQNLDGAMWDRIRHFVSDVRSVRLRDIGGVVLDIKDESGNINDWHHLHRHAQMEPCEIPRLSSLISTETCNEFPPMPWFDRYGKGAVLVMIARVETPEAEEALRRALYSASGLCFGAYVVLDSRSSDRASEIVLESGALRVLRKWDNDFSAARNYAADGARAAFLGAAWLVILDADEELVMSDDILTLMENPGIDGIGMEVHIATDEGPVVQKRSIRAYRPGGAHWERPIHNQLVGVKTAAQSGGRIITSYKGVMKERAQRQLPVLMRELERDPADPHTLKYLIRVLHTLESWDMAEALALRLVPIAGDDPIYSDVWLQLASLSRRRGDFGRSFSLLVEGIKKHPGNGEIWRHLMGICLMGWVGHSDTPSVYDGTSRMAVPDLHAKAAEAAHLLRLPVTFREAKCPSVSEDGGG